VRSDKDVAERWFVVPLCGRFLNWVPAPKGGSISFVRPKEIDERKWRPDVTPFGFPAMLARSGGSGTR